MSEIATLQRKVTQLDNDVSAIYSMLANIEGMQRRHGTRLDAIDGRLDGIDGRLDGLDGRLDGLDGRLASIEELLKQLLAR